MGRSLLFKQLDRRWLLVGLGVLAIYVVVPQIGSFRHSWPLVSAAGQSSVLLAIGFTFATYLLGAGTYYFLASQPLKYRQLVLVQLAAMAVNKLLPAGIGALGANYAYMRGNGYSKVQAGGTVTVNNLLGIIGHFCVLLAIWLIFGRTSKITIWHHLNTMQSALILALLIGLILAYVFARQALKNFFKVATLQLGRYREKPSHLSAALLTSIGLTLCNLFCLAACAAALNIHLAFLAVLIVFSVGISGGTIVPTPGGVGGFEAGLVGALAAYHVPASNALALALLYRLISYWLPLIFGALAFAVCQERKLFSS